MSRNALFLLLLLLAGAMLTWVIWPEQSQTPLAVNSENAGESEEPALPASEIPEAKAEIEIQKPAETRTEVSEAEGAPSKPEILSAAEGADAVVIRTQDINSHDPVPHCDVYALYPDDFDPTVFENLMAAGQNSIEDICVKYGRHYRTDEKGVTAIPRPDNSPNVLLLARKDLRFAFGFNFSLEDPEWVLVLEEEFILDVLVVDQHGVPQPDVPVAIRMRNDNFSFSIYTQASDENGVAHLKNLNLFFNQDMRGNGNLFVGLGILLPPDEAQKPEHEFPLSQDLMGSTGHELRLPPYGSISIELVNEDGDAIQPEATGHLSSFHDSSSGQFSDLGDEERVSLAEDGFLHFPYVTLNQDFQLNLSMGGIPAGDPTDFRGPTSNGQVVDIKYMIQQRPVLIGQLLKQDRSPVAEKKVVVTIAKVTGDSRNQNNIRTRTDASGHFKLELPAEDPEANWTMREVEFQLRPDGEGNLHGKIDLSFTLPAGERDLGEIIMEAAPELVSGLVQNSKGDAIPGARVRLQQQHFWGSNSENYYWNTLQGAVTRSGRDGSFRITGEAPAGAYRIDVSASSFLKLEQDIQIGQTDLVLKLQAGGILNGTVLFDPEFPAEEFSVRAVSIGPEVGKETVFRSNLQAVASKPNEYRFHFDQIPAQKCSLRLLGPGRAMLLETVINGIIAGQDSTPTEWNPLDLRGKLKVIQFNLVTQDGLPLKESATAHLRDGRTHASIGSEIKLYTLDIIPELVIQCPGYQAVSLEDVYENQTVTMRDGIAVQIRIPAALAQAEGYSLHAELYPRSINHSIIAGENADFDFSPDKATRASAIFNAQGNADLKLSAPGMYYLSLTLKKPGKANRTSRTHLSLPSGVSEIEVLEQTGMQIISIPLSKETLTQALEGLTAQDR